MLALKMFKLMYLYASVLKHTGQSAESESLYSRLYQELDAIIDDDNPYIPLYILKAYCCEELFSTHLTNSLTAFV